jgi:hypothetical protein
MIVSGDADGNCNPLHARKMTARLHLGYHLKTGHTLSVQNRPTELAEDVIVLPCFSVRLQGADSVVEAGLDI